MNLCPWKRKVDDNPDSQLSLLAAADRLVGVLGRRLPKLEGLSRYQPHVLIQVLIRDSDSHEIYSNDSVLELVATTVNKAPTLSWPYLEPIVNFIPVLFQLVESLCKRMIPSGLHTLRWDGFHQASIPGIHQNKSAEPNH